MSKPSKNKEKFVRVCPKCESKNVDIDPVIGNIAPFYICKSCGFGGPLFPEVSLKESKKIEEKAIKYSPIFSPTKKPLSIPLLIIPLVIMIIIIILLIFLGR